jgi:hypothetical protein
MKSQFDKTQKRIITLRMPSFPTLWVSSEPYTAESMFSKSENFKNKFIALFLYLWFKGAVANFQYGMFA